MKLPTLRPGQRITYLANPDSHETVDWRTAEIEDVLDVQITFGNEYGDVGFLMNADYGRLWMVK